MNDKNQNKIEVLITFPLSDELIQKLKEVSPKLNITLLPAKNHQEIDEEVWSRTEVLITERVIPPVEKVSNLRWIQFNYAGIDFALNEEVIKKPKMRVTTLSGAAAPQVAEYILTMMLALSHKIPSILKYEMNHEWPADRFVRFTPRELRNSTVGLIGYGSISRELARILKPLGVKILACKKNVMETQDQGYMIPELGDPNGDLFTRLYPYQAIKTMIKECDYVVVTVPRTKETVHLIAEDELTAMKSTAYLVDVSRGGIVKNTALKNALQEKKIAGAVLDVFEQEPLPKDHPIWDTPNLIISPHIAGVSNHYNERAVDLIVENVKRYLNNNSLLNTLDLDEGY
jgi:phosphoglycerate dehydrogenase-like enzyme